MSVPTTTIPTTPQANQQTPATAAPVATDSTK